MRTGRLIARSVLWNGFGGEAVGPVREWPRRVHAMQSKAGSTWRDVASGARHSASRDMLHLLGRYLLERAVSYVPRHHTSCTGTDSDASGT